MNLWTRFWPLTGLAFVGLFVAAILITDDLDTNDSDDKIAGYYTSNSHQTKQIASFLMILGACLLFVWFLAMLRSRLAQAEPGGRWTALAFGSGLVAVALWLVADALFSAAAFAADDTDKFHLDPNTYRILNGAGYAVWFSGTTIALGTVAATAIVALKTGLLPRWLAWLSFPVAVTMLVSFVFIPFLIMCGWIIVVAVTLMLRRAAPAAGAMPPGPA